MKIETVSHTEYRETYRDLNKSMPSKYRNKKCVYKDMIFDSLKELNRYMELELLQKAGKIKNLERQVKFKLTAGIKYIADFTYRTPTMTALSDRPFDILTVEDVKSKATKTATYRIKKKLMQSVYGIMITEV